MASYDFFQTSLLLSCPPPSFGISVPSHQFSLLLPSDHVCLPASSLLPYPFSPHSVVPFYSLAFVATAGYILMYEDLDLEAANEREHAVFAFLGLGRLTQYDLF